MKSLAESLAGRIDLRREASDNPTQIAKMTINFAVFTTRSDISSP
jgi:hypothetical protein